MILAAPRSAAGGSAHEGVERAIRELLVAPAVVAEAPWEQAAYASLLPAVLEAVVVVVVAAVESPGPRAVPAAQVAFAAAVVAAVEGPAGVAVEEVAAVERMSSIGGMGGGWFSRNDQSELS